MTHTLTLPPLTDLNTYINLERTNKFAAASVKKKETELVAWECKRQKLPALKLTKITFIWKHKNRRKSHPGVEVILEGKEIEI